MTITHRMITASITAAFLIASGASATGQTVIAGEDFDGGAVNLIGGFDAAADNIIDGFGGNFFGAGSLANWPQGNPPGIPFSVTDDTVEGVSSQGMEPPFPIDREAVYGLDADINNVFFCISDTVGLAADIGQASGEFSASWIFDISSATGPLQLSIGLGQQSDGDSFDGFDAGLFLFEYSVDGGAFQTAFSCDPFDSTGSGFTYRGMDSGDPVTTFFVCQATGPNPITKISAESGSPESNTILNRTPPNGSPNAGVLDTFVTDINGSGNQIEIRVTGMVAFEGMAFDDIEILEMSGGGGGTVPANNLTVFRGIVVSGGLAETTASDDMRFNVNPGFTINDTEAPAWLIFDGTLPSDSPSSLELVRESLAGTPGLTVTTEVWNFNTSTFDEVDVTDEVFNVDTVVTVDLTTGIGDYVEASTGDVQTRIGWRQTSFTINFPWVASVDHVFWEF